MSAQIRYELTLTLLVLSWLLFIGFFIVLIKKKFVKIEIEPHLKLFQLYIKFFYDGIGNTRNFDGVYNYNSILVNIECKKCDAYLNIYKLPLKLCNSNLDYHHKKIILKNGNNPISRACHHKFKIIKCKRYIYNPIKEETFLLADVGMEHSEKE